MNYPRTFRKSASIALGWVLLTTPATTLPLLMLIHRHGGRLADWIEGLSATAAATLVGSILIVPPIVGIILALFALGSVRSSWTPVRGAGLARAALIIGSLSLAAAALLFIAG